MCWYFINDWLGWHSRYIDEHVCYLPWIYISELLLWLSGILIVLWYVIRFCGENICVCIATLIYILVCNVVIILFLTLLLFYNALRGIADSGWRSFRWSLVFTLLLVFWCLLWYVTRESGNIFVVMCIFLKCTFWGFWML